VGQGALNQLPRHKSPLGCIRLFVNNGSGSSSSNCARVGGANFFASDFMTGISPV
jgi:hypothetical protein